MKSLSDILRDRQLLRQANERNAESPGAVPKLDPGLSSFNSFVSLPVTVGMPDPVEATIPQSECSHPRPGSPTVASPAEHPPTKTYETLLHLIDDFADRNLTLQRDGAQVRITGSPSSEDLAFIEENLEGLLELFLEREDIIAAENPRR